MKFFVFFFALGLASRVLAETQYGLFMIVKGDVKIVRQDQTSLVAKVGSKIAPGETVVSGADSRAKIVMTDRNVINVSPLTQVQISKYLNDSKTGLKDVELKLNQGKVRNNVEQTYDGEKSKFILKTPTAVAGVRGTQFVGSFDQVTQKTEIVTMKGQVVFSSVMNGQVVGQPVVVSKGEVTSSSPGAPPEAPKSLPKKELREIDKDSTAATKSTPNETAGGPNGSGSGGGGPNGAAEPGRNTEGKSPDGRTESHENASRDGRGRDPANAPSPQDISMIDPADIAPMKPPPRPGPTMDLPPPRDYRPPVIPVPNPLVRDIIRDQTGRTKLVIIPQ